MAEAPCYREGYAHSIKERKVRGALATIFCLQVLGPEHQVPISVALLIGHMTDCEWVTWPLCVYFLTWEMESVRTPFMDEFGNI